MPIVNIGSQRYTVVIAEDAPGAGGACHEYRIAQVEHTPDTPAEGFAVIRFQDGPMKEAGVNGCHNEDLLAIVMHRLQGFQSGKYACYENREALACIQAAMNFLNNRTLARNARGVEGTHAL